jgi:YD repeat-containing protein
MIQDNIASVTEPNGVVTTYTYNSLNRLTDEVVKNAGGTVLANYGDTLDNAGNRTGVTETQLLPNGTTDTRTVDRL